MKNTTIHFIILYILLTACIVGLILSFVLQPTSAERIFRNHMRTVVEVRAWNDPQEKAFGSAVAISRNGTFITNAHVISFRHLSNDIVFDNIQIRFATDEHFIDASLERIDHDIDLAKIKIDNTGVNIQPARFRNTRVHEGERVYAIGNAQNHGISIIQGLVSKREVNIEVGSRTITAIQCALLITQGNSGGALVDARGDLIGITTFRLRDSGGNVIYGLSFAISISVVQRFLDSM